ncbi:glycosyltransferase [Pseudarthrobacter sp. PS3-L1]|uniref:glycosyltransferase family protein n=1 Tax=Pseudarthrobacter sp. PS3-L1 TaxID=3046207 RepID=UPI0024B922C0|nr:glycosyltransferase [Pseudarthrobacter sp. PS3-L1]MDJ0321743.1 glycosyltransferase [Pseudarthrobacter sp. PS3-L1]
MKFRLSSTRKLLWHFRAGGAKQVKVWLERESHQAGFRKIETLRGAEGAWVGRGKNKQLTFRPMNLDAIELIGGGKPSVGVILDEFSLIGFSFEWNCIPLSPANWRQELDSQAVDFVFVESAWRGSEGRWAGKIARTSNPMILSELTKWCRRHEIPTIFWNKEDPPHYEDFLPAARLFDYVYTSDANKLPDYQRDLGHNNVDVLAFAAQPLVHNPIRPAAGWHERDVAFGGMYFTEKYPERQDQMDLLLGAATKASRAMDTGLEIFSRQRSDDPRYSFPPALEERVVGSLTYPQMLTAYKAYKTFLNVNSVVDSPTMCSRRVFEIIAAGSVVVTTASRAIETYFKPDEIFEVSSSGEADSLLRALHRNQDIGDRQLHRGQRKIWQEHTYALRSEQIIKAAVPKFHREATRRASISALVPTIRPWQLEHVFRTIASQRNVNVELVLLTHGFSVKTKKIDELKAMFGLAKVSVIKAEKHISLGECLNLCIEAAEGEVLAKMDDDDFYAPDYLSDQLYSLEYSRADIVGKQAHYMHLESRNTTILRFPSWEHRYTRTVMGPTLMGYSSVFTSSGFAPIGSGEDTRFLKDVSEQGGVIYAADRFNYCQQRNSQGHTWKISDDELLATGDFKLIGDYRDHVSV